MQTRRLMLAAFAAIGGAAAVAGLLTVASRGPVAADSIAVKAQPAAAPVARPGTALATFAAGCFWCVEADFDRLPGVLETTSGYTGGRTPFPTYESVASGRTGHVEALQVVYDPQKVSYQTLLTWYWRHVDPIDGGGQFCDRGAEYRPVIFVHDDEQRRLAEKSKAQLASSGLLDRPIAVTIEPAKAFTPAEAEHQDYYKKNPLRYLYYRFGCGRDQRIDQIWSKTG